MSSSNNVEVLKKALDDAEFKRASKGIEVAQDLIKKVGPELLAVVNDQADQAVSEMPDGDEKDAMKQVIKVVLGEIIIGALSEVELKSN